MNTHTQLKDSLTLKSYTNDIPYPSSGIQLELFTDGTALYLRSTSKLRVVLYNTTYFPISNDSIPRHHTYKYLGKTFDKHISTSDIKRDSKLARFYTGITLLRRDRSSVLHRDLELPTILKFTKNVSERFFTAVENPNLLSSADAYEAPPPHHFIRRSRNVLLDRSEALTDSVKRLGEVNNMAED
ncbi:hypothetical protein EVAR_103397_1 [Eumeta japonica]|uniref:Uncharacterized protein n=1 Tax=Eumeta variegata TaxID=151549 RepID=A0A4C1YRF7_EUMVA|nr:hypothetical protein EVAR_103397_1 [Eumeta japonica]